MDKSLDDLISEQRSKSKPARDSKDHARARRGHVEESKDKRATRPDSRRNERKDNRRQDAGGAPPREPAYFMHDDRDGGFAERQQQGLPSGSWKQAQRQQWSRQQQQQQHRPRGRGAATATTDPIITTADGWEEVAQEDNHTDRRGGAGVQRRGSVFDRMSRDRAEYGGGRGFDRQNGRQQHTGGRFGRGRGPSGGGRGREESGEQPRRRYMDEHDHREDEPAGRPGRFQPYRVAGGISKRSARGPTPFGRKWANDLFDPNQPDGPAPEEAEEVAGEADGMME